VGVKVAAGVVVLAVAFLAVWMRKAPPPAAGPLSAAPLEVGQEAAVPSNRGEPGGESSEPDHAREAVGEPIAEVSAAADELEWHLVGRFLDMNGVPLAGVQLEVRGAEPPIAATSDAGGHVRANLGWPYTGRTVGAGQVELNAFGDALTRQRWYVPVEGPGEQLLGEIRMLSAGAVTGRVVDVSGRPVEGAYVRCSGAFEPANESVLDEARTFGWHRTHLGNFNQAVTDAAGDYRLDGIPAGSVSVWASTGGRPDAYSSPHEVRPGGTAYVDDIVLLPANPANLIRGVVLGGDGDPLHRVSISFSGDLEYRLEGARYVTDREGRFQLLVARDRTYTLEFNRDRSSNDGIRLEVPAGADDVVVRLASPRHMTVIPRSPDGETLQGATLQITSDRGYLLHTNPREKRDGTLRFRMPDALFHVYVLREGWVAEAKSELFDPATAPEELVVEMARGAGLRGRVVSAGRPLGGARVHAHSVRDGTGVCSDDGFRAPHDYPGYGATETDANGEFFVQLFSTSSFVLHAEREGYGRATLGPVGFVEGRDVGGLDLALSACGALEGHVLCAEDVPVRGTIVGISGGDAHVLTQKVGADGAYRFEDLAPGRYQVLRCDPGGMSRLESGTWLHADPRDPVDWQTEVHAGKTTVFDLDLRSRVPCTLSAELRFDGAPARGWSCNLGGDEWEYGALDANGRVTLGSPAPGNHWLNLYGGSRSGVYRQVHQTVELFANDNDWFRDFATGTVVLTDLPELAPLTNDDIPATHYILALGAEQSPLWRAMIFAAAAGDLVIPEVPAGDMRLYRLPENPNAMYEPLTSWPLVLELTVAPGRETRVEVP
jgi:hypothetical protein